MAQETKHASGQFTPAAGERRPDSSSRQFVINLCTLPTPISVPQPRSARLTRYSFFISHSWQEDRRQYHLHMGHFNTPAEAEKWLTMLQRVYPNAHVAEAPDSQPELMSNTQRLRILDIGRIGLDPASAGALDRLDVHRLERPVSRAAPVQTHGYVKPGGPASGNPPAGSRPGTPTSSNRASTSAGRTEPSLEDTLNELRTSQFDMGTDDDMNATGVRHLKFEVQKSRRR